jgi:hypothetical protein
MMLMPNGLARYGTQSVQRSVEYRTHLYSVAVPDIASRHVLWGAGAASTPEGINEIGEVPDDIALSLQSGQKFASHHDLLLDVAQRFGLVCAALFVAVQTAWLRGWRHIAPQDRWYAVAWGVLALNAFVNVPSLELTLLLVAMTGGLYALSRQR